MLGIRLWLSVWTRIKKSLDWTCWDKIDKTFYSKLRWSHLTNAWKHFRQKKWENIFWGFFSPATLAIDVTQILVSFSSALWKKRRVKGTTWGLWTQKHPLKSSLRLSSCTVFVFPPTTLSFVRFTVWSSLLFSHLFRPPSFTDFYFSSPLWSFLCNLTRKVYASLTTNQHTQMDR